MHQNDTLQGRLLAWEREDQKHLRRCFGYWHMVERRMIRETWSGPSEPTVFEIMAAIEANHKNDLTYAETSGAFSARVAPGPPSLSAEEWAFLAERFEDANDPVAASIWLKALARR